MQFNRFCLSCRRRFVPSGARYYLHQLGAFLIRCVRKPFWRMVAMLDRKSIYYCGLCGHESLVAGRIF